MNAVLYHQKQKTDSVGRKIFIGEDAYPYADGELLIVADGLGGRGGYPHTKIDPRILDRDLFYDLVFAPVFDASVSPDFKKFVVDSFNEIFETKDYYFDNSATTRSSGYFASRLVTAIALYELKYNDYFKKENVFAKLNCASDGEKEKRAQEFGNELASELLKKLTVIAENVGFEIETKLIGAYLLPSTLTLALFDEHVDYVDALYLWAGDSRGYLWDGKGLAQVTEDHEKDETMTNLVTLTKPFRIEGRFVRFEKPCLLFNATDGCYKCPVFASPFDLEYIFLQSISQSDSFVGVERFLAEQFHAIGRHDDSNTLALASFGFENYESVKEAVEERLRVIDETIIQRLPGILEVDYPYELQQAEDRMNDELFALKERLITLDAVIGFVKDKMTASEYAVLQKEKAELTEEKDRCAERKKELASEIELWIKQHWIKPPQLKRNSSAAQSFKIVLLSKKDPYAEYEGYAERLKGIEDAYTRSVGNVVEKQKDLNDRIVGILTDISDIRRANSFEYESYTRDRNEMLEILDFINKIGKKNFEFLLQFRATQRKIKELNESYAEYDRDAVKETLNKFLFGEVDASRFDSELDEPTGIAALLTEYAGVRESIERLTEELEKLPDLCYLRYWNDKYEELIPEIWEEHRSLIPEELTASVEQDTIGTKAKRDELKRCCELREQIYRDYENGYRRIYEESKL